MASIQSYERAREAWGFPETKDAPWNNALASAFAEILDEEAGSSHTARIATALEDIAAALEQVVNVIPQEISVGWLIRVEGWENIGEDGAIWVPPSRRQKEKR